MKKDQPKALPLPENAVILYILVLIFFLFKLNHLNIPYYWDELGVYTKAALYMHDHGVTLLPGIIPAELSRGHPLLCAAIFGSAYKLLGPHVWVGHLAAITLSCMLLIVFFKLCKELLGFFPSIIACLVLMVQPVFIAQAGMVLPEIMLSFFCTGALLAYIKRQFYFLALWSALAIMTKETAIAIPAAIIAIEFFSILLKKELNRDNLRFAAAALFPIFTWGVFLIGQKLQHGWFFFPLHSDYVSFSLDQIFARTCYYLSFLFKGQGRYVWTIVCALSLLLYFTKNRNSILSNSWQFIRLGLIDRRPWTILFFFSAMGLVASSLNFHLARYTLFFLPALTLLVMAFSCHLFRTIGKLPSTMTMLAMVVTPLFYYEAKVFTFDADMGFRHAVVTQKAAAEFIDLNYNPDTVIMSDFPMNTGLQEERAGYTNNRAYTNTRHGCGNENTINADLYVYTYPGNLEICNPKTKHLKHLKEFKSSFARVHIYQKLK